MQKIIFIITKLELGGAQKVCLELLFGLDQKEFQTQIFTSSGGFFDTQVQESHNVTFIPGLSNSLSPRGLFGNLKAAWQIYKLLSKELIHFPNLTVHTHSSAAGFFGRIAAWAAGVKHIVHTVHGFSFNPYQKIIKRFLLRQAERMCAKLSTALVFVSKRDLELAVNKLKIDKKKCYLIRACMQHWPSKPTPSKPLSGHQLTIGTVACFKPQKNLLDLLKVFLEIRKKLPQTRLLIVGDGQERKMLESFIEKHRLKNVTLLGWLDNLDHFYKHIDVFALTSLWEGLPCSVVEALVRSVPVVAYEAGGISEVVLNGQNGFVVPSLDRVLFQERMLFVLNNIKKPYFNFQTEALVSEFSPQAMVLKHRDLYRLIG